MVTLDFIVTKQNQKFVDIIILTNSQCLTTLYTMFILVICIEISTRKLYESEIHEIV